jgi:hypothetical protein
MTQDKKNPPVSKFRDRNLTVNIWERNNEHGLFHEVTFERSYKDGEEWKKTGNIPAQDLQNLRKLLDLAHTAILERRARLKDQPDHADGEEIQY